MELEIFYGEIKTIFSHPKGSMILAAKGILLIKNDEISRNNYYVKNRLSNYSSRELLLIFDNDA